MWWNWVKTNQNRLRVLFSKSWNRKTIWVRAHLILNGLCVELVPCTRRGEYKHIDPGKTTPSPQTPLQKQILHYAQRSGDTRELVHRSTLLVADCHLQQHNRGNNAIHCGGDSWESINMTPYMRQIYKVASRMGLVVGTGDTNNCLLGYRLVSTIVPITASRDHHNPSSQWSYWSRILCSGYKSSVEKEETRLSWKYNCITVYSMFSQEKVNKVVKKNAADIFNWAPINWQKAKMHKAQARKDKEESVLNHECKCWDQCALCSFSVGSCRHWDNEAYYEMRYPHHW